MVGMPYPNPNDPILVEKVAYAKGRLGTASEYLEDICMKAVNQSIGRAVRHAKDYAVIVLADTRYTRASVQAKLPKWVAHRLLFAQQTASFSEILQATARFFAAKKPQQVAIEQERKNRHQHVGDAT
jgi:chromosome transmission fidelity protein 1